MEAIATQAVKLFYEDSRQELEDAMNRWIGRPGTQVISMSFQVAGGGWASAWIALVVYETTS